MPYCTVKKIRLEPQDQRCWGCEAREIPPIALIDLDAISCDLCTGYAEDE